MTAEDAAALRPVIREAVRLHRPARPWEGRFDVANFAAAMRTVFKLTRTPDRGTCLAMLGNLPSVERLTADAWRDRLARFGDETP